MLPVSYSQQIILAKLDTVHVFLKIINKNYTENIHKYISTISLSTTVYQMLMYIRRLGNAQISLPTSVLSRYVSLSVLKLLKFFVITS